MNRFQTGFERWWGVHGEVVGVVLWSMLVTVFIFCWILAVMVQWIPTIIVSVIVFGSWFGYVIWKYGDDAP